MVYRVYYRGYYGFRLDRVLEILGRIACLRVKKGK